MKILRALALMFLAAMAVNAQPPPHPAHPQILATVTQISADTLFATITRMTQFHTRHTFSDTTSDSTGIGAAMRWLETKAASYDAGGRFTFEWFPWIGSFGGGPVTRHNLIARVAGNAPERARYVVGGHYDSRTVSAGDNTSFAPGADDNGSSCAAFLELLRLLPGTTAHDLEVIWFTGEEQGLWGSEAYAEHLSQQQARVDGMIAMDMIGHIAAPGGAIDSSSARLYAQGPAESSSRQLQRYLKWVGEAYSDADSFALVIVPAADRPGRGSDHLSFSAEGYPALRVIERNEDLAYQHTANDLPQHMSPAYARHVAMCAFGGLLTMLQAPARPPELEVTALVPGHSYQLHVPDSVVLPDGGRFYLAVRDYLDSHFDQIIDLGTARDYIDSTQAPDALVAYSVSRADANGLPSPFSNEVTIWVTSAGSPPAPLPDGPHLSSSPNPFNGEVTFSLEIPQAGAVSLAIYDLLGRHVADVLNKPLEAGTHRIAWTPHDLASGVYLARLNTASGTLAARIAYIR